ncbi:MAG: galactokinase [Marmoricola sp.]|nr:galactokinase [Marmoricola sp.]
MTQRSDRVVRITSRGAAWEGSVTSLDDAPSWVLYVAGVLVALEVDAGLDIEITSDVPVGAGLSSSAALECSVAVAVDDLLGLGLSQEQLVAACTAAERETVGAPTGGLDQAAAVYTTAEHALLVDFADDSRAQVPFDPGAHDLAVLVTDTRVSHELTDGGYGARRDDAWEAAELLGLRHLAGATADQLTTLPHRLVPRARHVVSEVARVDAFVDALRAGDWTLLGGLLDASHASLRDDYEVSCEELDVSVEVARQAGALGARMTGGGFGGSTVALVPTARVEAVQAAVTTEFAARGWTPPDHFVVEPGPGARVEA